MFTSLKASFGVVVLLVTACGIESNPSSTNNLWPQSRTKYVVTAEVTNSSSQKLEIAFLNNGPHGGECDSKNYVLFEVDANTTKTISETWHCKMEQWFHIYLPKTGENYRVEANNPVNVHCDATTCVVEQN